VPALERIETFQVTSGRYIDDIDIRDRRKVAILGEDVITILFEGQGDPLGKIVNVQGVNFLVVGTFTTDQPGEDGARVKLTVQVPFTTFQEAFNQNQKVGWFSMTVRGGARGEEVEEKVKRLLATTHGASPDDPQATGSYNSARDFGKVTGVFIGIKFFIWFVGIVTLLAGMLGVSNIMLIVVKERTREFGVRKAIGATPSSIVALVIQEALTLTAVAGYTGLVVAVGFLEFTASFGDPTSMLGNPSIDFNVALIAVGVLMVAGLLAGIVPARHAARINPVEALRSE
jgi:putative ABC transport system permease protein